MSLASAASSLASELASNIAALSATTPHTSAITRTFTDESGSPSVISLSMVSSPPPATTTPGPEIATVAVYGDDSSVLTSYTTTLLPRCSGPAAAGGDGGIGGLLGGVGGVRDGTAVAVTVFFGVLLFARFIVGGRGNAAGPAAGARGGEGSGGQ